MIYVFSADWWATYQGRETAAEDIFTFCWD